MLADAFIHDLNPVILPISGAFAIRWYGVSYLVGFIIAWAMIRWLGKHHRIAIPGEHAMDFIIYCVGGVIIGGRLGFCLLYDLPRALDAGVTPLLWDFSSSPPFWGLLRLNEGGMASHGGIAGVALAGYLLARRLKVPWLHIMDCAAFTCVIGLGIGRVANFINAELWGKRLPDDLQGAASPWWSVKYPQEIADFAANDPAKVMQATDIPQAISVSPMQWQQHIADFAANEESRRIVSGWIARIIEEVRNGNEQLITALGEVLTAYYPSQIIQAIVEGPIMLAIMAVVWLRPRRPGVIGCTFMIAYGILRIFTEVFRQPDDGVAVIFGLQRGQLLSVGMIVVGCGVLALAFYWRRPKMGGLLSPAPLPAAAAQDSG